MTLSRSKRRPGFTLVEMLVVISIIGVLAALLVPTIQMALQTAREATIGMEVDQMSQAMEQYKSKHNGDYPPDFSNVAAVVAHVRKSYPRNQLNVTAWLTSTLADNRRPANLDPAEAFIFWLAMVKNNPRNPLAGAGEVDALFPFDETRLTCPLFPDPADVLAGPGPDVDGDWWPEYEPKHAKGAPYVYFDGRIQGGQYLYTTAVYPPGGGAGSLWPYRSETQIDTQDNNRTTPNDKAAGGTLWNTKWLNPGKFQLISAGMDREYGAVPTGASGLPIYRKFPAVAHMVDGHADNLANFSDGRTFEDNVP